MKTIKSFITELHQMTKDDESMIFIKKTLPSISLICISLLMFGILIGLIVNV